MTTNKAPYLTRGEAHQLIEDCCSDLMRGEDGSHESLFQLAQHWEKTAGCTPSATGFESATWAQWATTNEPHDRDAEWLAEALHEFVDAKAAPADRTPHEDDPTELTAPDEEGGAL